MSIFKLYPVHKDYLWGGTRLNTDFHKNRKGIVAETWELSTHPDGLSTIVESDSSYNNKPLAEYLKDHPKALGNGSGLPLIKFIDAAKDLSIQVHPNNEYALAHENQNGKTECWYIMDAAPNSTLYYGVNRELTKSEFKEAIENDKVLEVLNKVSIKTGDFFYIPAGTIHAIGAGALIAEIQQNSNVTYRVYDFKRKDANGNLRQLHVDKAIEVANLKPSSNDYDFNGHLCQTPYFTVDKINVNSELNLDPHTYNNKSSFHSLLILEGSGQITDGIVTYSLEKGDSFFVSAEHDSYSLYGDFTMLLTTA